MNRLEYQSSYSRNLPHIQPPGATLFVIFRLAGTLLLPVVEQLRGEMALRVRELVAIEDEKGRAQRFYAEQWRAFGRLDALLDTAGYGPRFLAEPAVAQVVREAFHFLDGRLFELDVYCIMSNHVHVVFTPWEIGEGEYVPLSRIMHSLKRYTAREIN